MGFYRFGRGKNTPPVGAQIDWSHPLSRELKALWMFNERSGSRIHDLAAGMVAPFTNMDQSNWKTGHDGGTSLSFNGTDEQLTPSTEVKFKTSEPFSLMFTYRGTENRATSTIGRPFAAYDQGSVITSAIGLDNSGNGKFTWHHYHGSGWASLESNQAVNDDVFHQLVFVNDPSDTTGYLYIDGVFDNSGDSNLNYGPNPYFRMTHFMFGDWSSNDRWTAGELGQVRAWGMMLTPDMVRWLWNQPNAGVVASVRRQYWTPAGAPPAVPLTDQVSAIS